MSDARPLTPEEREAFPRDHVVRYSDGDFGHRVYSLQDILRYEATVQAAEARAEAERERAERAEATIRHYHIHPADLLTEIHDAALAADDQRAWQLAESEEGEA